MTFECLVLSMPTYRFSSGYNPGLLHFGAGLKALQRRRTCLINRQVHLTESPDSLWTGYREVSSERLGKSNSEHEVGSRTTVFGESNHAPPAGRNAIGGMVRT